MTWEHLIGIAVMVTAVGSFVLWAFVTHRDDRRWPR